MPYRRTYRRRPTYRKKSTLTRLTKPKKTTAIQALAKQIKTIKSAMKREVNLHQYQYGTRQTIGGTVGADLTGPFYQFAVSQFSSWSRIFGTGTNDQEMNAMIWKSFGMDVRIWSYNETGLVNFTVFLVSTTPMGGDLINAAGSLVLTEGVEYINSSAGANDTASGLVMLNKKYFNIHGIKRFTLGNNGTALGNPSAQTQYGTDRRMYFKVKPNKKVVNPNGDVFAQTYDKNPTGNYYLLVFNDNSSADLEAPRIVINTVCTIDPLE